MAREHKPAAVSPSDPDKDVSPISDDEDFSLFFQSAEFSDLQVVVGSQREVFHLHRIILSQKSDLLKNMLAGGRDTIHLPTVEGQIFDIIIQYVYSKDLTQFNQSLLDVGVCLKVVKAARYLQFDRATKAASIRTLGLLKVCRSAKEAFKNLDKLYRVSSHQECERFIETAHFLAQRMSVADFFEIFSNQREIDEDLRRHCNAIINQMRFPPVNFRSPNQF